jgi:hypothetical protein
MEINEGVELERISGWAHAVWAVKLIAMFVVPCIVCVAGGIAVCAWAVR